MSYYDCPKCAYPKEACTCKVTTTNETIEKAYGGCRKCYGKGYATQLEFATGRGIVTQLPYYLPCSCHRGTQFANAMKYAAAEEREACAKVCEEQRRDTDTPPTIEEPALALVDECNLDSLWFAINSALTDAAAAIRARGQDNENTV
jgi:hypothetical protein